MIKHFCDFCGKEIPEGRRTYTIKIDNTAKQELCTKCWKEFMRVIRIVMKNKGDVGK